MALLTVDTAPTYVTRHIDKVCVLQKGVPLTADEIGGGNLNYAFRVGDADGHSVFVKQAPDFIKVLPDVKLHRERMVLEIKAYREWESVLDAEMAASMLPRIMHTDLENMIVIMEFLGSYQCLDNSLFAGVASEQVAGALGEFMGMIHGRTHSSKVIVERASSLTEAFANATLRGIQLDYVFSKAFRESERAAALREDETFMSELEKLKAAYRGEHKDNLSLTHGDLHPGSVMVDVEASRVKIIDPEFAIYGPPGLDIGSLLSGYVLAYTSHRAAGGECADRLLACIAKVWSSYVVAMKACSVSDEFIRQAGEDAVGFAACEVMRTLLGFAGVRGLSIDDAAAKAKVEESALSVGKRCVMGRVDGIDFLLDELKKEP